MCSDVSNLLRIHNWLLVARTYREVCMRSRANTYGNVDAAANGRKCMSPWALSPLSAEERIESELPSLLSSRAYLTPLIRE